MKALEDGKEAAWEHIVDQKGYACDRCGNPPSYDEREIYFETGYCGWCAYEVARDD